MLSRLLLKWLVLPPGLSRRIFEVLGPWSALTVLVRLNTVIAFVLVYQKEDV